MVDQQNAFFNSTYDDNYNKVMKYVISKCSNTNDIQDIMQEIFVEFYALINRKGILYIKNSEAILIKIAKTKVYRHYNLKEKVQSLLHENRNEEEYETAEDIAIINEDLDDKISNRFTIEEIWKIIDGKTEEVKKLFYLYYYCEMTLREIAELMKINESNVKHKIYRTLEEIRSNLKGW